MRRGVPERRRWSVAFSKIEFASSIDLQDAPLAALADQEVGLTVAPTIRGAEAQQAVREEEDACTVGRLCDPHLGPGSEAQVVPSDRHAGGRGLVVDTPPTGDLE
jgi:hypothetical protein